jgi:hypothetical protein
VDITEKQLPSQDTVSVALDRWTLTNTTAIMAGIAYYINQNWAL